MKTRAAAHTLAIVAVAGAVCLFSGGARAEDSPRGVVVFAHGGGYSPVTDLDEAGTAQFKTGFVVGGGVGYQVNRYVVVRANFNYARNDGDAPLLGTLDGVKYNRFLYDADIQLRYPTASGLTPYILGGGGATTVQQDVTDGPSFTKGAGKFGAGFTYEVPDTTVSLYAEGTGWAYKWDKDLNPAFTKTQVDIAWTAGLSYRFGR